MSKRTQVWFVNGQLVTNNPAAFAKNFDLPETASVDGLHRVSHRLKKPKPAPIPVEDWDVDDFTDAVDDWLSEGEGGAEDGN